MRLRRNTYRAARWLGHAKAIQRGRAPHRLHNIAIGRLAARILNRLYR